MGPNLGLSFNEYKHYLSRGLRVETDKVARICRWTRRRKKTRKRRTFGCLDLRLIVADDKVQEPLDNRTARREDAK